MYCHCIDFTQPDYLFFRCTNLYQSFFHFQRCAFLTHIKDTIRCILLLSFKTKTLPHRVHILLVLVLIGVQRVNGFKSGRGSFNSFSSEPKWLCADPRALLPHAQNAERFSSVNLYAFSQSRTPQRSRNVVHLACPQVTRVQKRVHPVPAILIATLASPNCARLLCQTRDGTRIHTASESFALRANIVIKQIAVSQQPVWVRCATYALEKSDSAHILYYNARYVIPQREIKMHNTLEIPSQNVLILALVLSFANTGA